uniref:Uncharacterized protein n=1 Tax=Rhizophora mucronata TaxID=61149 RepID=A0A2P2QV54_RHIMU
MRSKSNTNGHKQIEMKIGVSRSIVLSPRRPPLKQVQTEQAH